MPNPRRYNQLTLLEIFDKSIKRDDKLVQELFEAINNFKYLRTNTRFSELPNKVEIEETLSQTLYWMGWLMWKKAKYVDRYKDNYSLDLFLDFTKEKTYLSVTEALSNETLSDYYQNAYQRIKTTFMAYKDLLQGEKVTTKRILMYWEHIHNLG